MALNVNFDRDLQLAINDLPGEVTISGTTANAVVDDARNADELSASGILADVSALIVHVRVASFASISPGQTLTYRTRVYRITRAEKTADGHCWALECEEKEA